MSKLLKYWKVLSLGAVVTAMGLFTASCVETEDEPTGFKVTITGGGSGATGSGSYAEGDTVKIFAGNAPAGKVFQMWTTSDKDVIFDDYESARTWFIMPGRAVAVGVWWESESVSTFSVTLNAGEKSAVFNENAEPQTRFEAGDTVVIFAGTKYKQVFDGWVSNDVDIEDDPNFTAFIMPNKNVSISVNWADAGGASVRFSWELAEQSSIQSIAANTKDVDNWYNTIFLGDDYNDLDATDYPWFVGNRDVPENLYSRTLHSSNGSPNKGKYFNTYEGNYTAVATVEDYEIDDPDGEPHVYDIVANYTLDVTSSEGKKFFEVAFDVGNFLEGNEDKGWFDDSFNDDQTDPRLEKKKAAKLLKKIKKGNVTYYVFKRAAKK
jgi:hypothetical protein